RTLESPSALQGFDLVASRRENFHVESAVSQKLILGKSRRVQTESGQENTEQCSYEKEGRRAWTEGESRNHAPARRQSRGLSRPAFLNLNRGQKLTLDI